MIRNYICLTLLLTLISTTTIADTWQDPDKDKEPRNIVGDVAEGSGKQIKNQPEDNNRTLSNINSSVEERERQKIITELTYRLETKSTCTQKLTWTDKGSGADLDGFFYTPSVEPSYYIIGGYAKQSGDTSSAKCVISVRQSKNNPKEAPELLISPIDWSLIWTDKGSGANMDGSMWHGVPPNNDYKCLGSVLRNGYEKPVLPIYRCVHIGLTKKIKSNSIVWTDKGSGADKDVTVFKLPKSKSFIAVGKKINQVETYDLNDTASIVPDSVVVEKLLTQRMEEINKIAAEKKRHAEEDEKKRIAKEKRLAEMVESKRIAGEKSLADEAEKERIAKETEPQERLAAKAEKQGLEQEAEKKRIAEETEQQERLAVEAEQQRLEEEAEKKRLAEESQQQSPADVHVEINRQQPIEKADKEDSKVGLKIIFVTLLTLLLYTIYRLSRALLNIIKGDH